MIHERHQTKTVPGPNLVRVLRQDSSKRRFCSTRITFRNAALTFRQETDGFGVVWDRGRRGRTCSRFFGWIGLVLGPRSSKVERRYALLLSASIDRSHPIREKQLHGGLGLLELDELREQRADQDVAVLVGALDSGIAL